MKKKFRYVFTFLLLFISFTLLSPIYGYPQREISPYSEAIKTFEKFVVVQMYLDKVPGLSVGFMKDGFTWAKGFGYSDLENRIPAKAENSYRMASITKTMTAIAVLQLVEAGKIDLDAEVQKYVPYFPRKKWPVTVRLLLGHLAGISHYRNYDEENHIKVHKNTKEALAIFQDFDLVAEPGTRYHYSSYGYNLLGAVIERASGRSYGQYIKEHIFDPLGMKNSRLDDPADLIPNRVRGYRLINGEIKNSEYVDISSRFAAGGTRSTVVDLLKYAKGIMEGKLLKKDTWKQMFKSMAIRSGFLTGYGMGWRVHPWNGHFQVYHGGTQHETKTYILIMPAENFAIALASNLEQMERMLYVRRLAELILDEDIDRVTYVQDSGVPLIHDACFLVFSYGMSRFSWLGHPIAEDKEDLARAFSHFNKYVDKKALKRNFKETRKKIQGGIHPVSNQAFTKVGTYIALTLSEAFGKEKLKGYHQTGPVSFFSDYIKLSEKWPSDREKFRFKKSFARLISDWEKDWSRIYTEDIRRLFITVDTDIDQLGTKLKQAFRGAKLYPDFSKDLARVGHYSLEQNEIEKSFKILNLNVELYPNSPLSFSSLAAAYIWTGNTKEARRLYKKAFAMSPKHPSVSLNEFLGLGRRLMNVKKIKEFFSLVEVAAELYPRNARFHKGIADLYLQIGQKEKALEFYRKALKINPDYKEAKESLEKLRKEK